MRKITRYISKAAACAVAASAMIFSIGCTNDLQNDVDDLKNRVATLEDAVEVLEQSFASGLMITSVDRLDDGTGYTINFAGGKSPVVINHGTKGDAGHSPLVTVVTNTDGTISLLVDGEVVVANIKGPKGDDGAPGAQGPKGDQGLAPKFKAEVNAEGQLRIYYTFSQAENPAPEEWTDLGVNFSASAGSNPLLYIVDNKANGTVTFVMNDDNEPHAEFTFARASSAQSFAILADVVAFDGLGNAEVKFRVNPSTAWVPTGSGDAVSKWALDQVGTRASYVNESEVFAIESVLPDGDKTGQYIATVSCDMLAADSEVNEYLVALVLNNNKEADPDNDILISSGMFKMTCSDLGPVETFTYAYPVYLGSEEYGEETTRFQLSLLTFNPIGSNISGWDMTMEIITDRINDANSEKFFYIPNGTYSFSEGTETNTVPLTADTYLRKVNALNDYEDQEITGGTLTIEGNSADGFTVTVIANRADGETFRGIFKGDMAIENENFWDESEQEILGIRSGGQFSPFFGNNGGLSNFSLMFDTVDTTRPDLVQTGFQFFTDFYGPVVDDGPNVEWLNIPEGRYELSTTKGLMTMVYGPWTYTYLLYQIDNIMQISPEITGGYMDVEGNGDNYTITLNVDTNKGKVNMKWVGPYKIKNRNYVPTTVPAPTGLVIEELGATGVYCYWDTPENVNIGTDGWIFRAQGKFTDQINPNLVSELPDGRQQAELSSKFDQNAATYGSTGVNLNPVLVPETEYTWQVCYVIGGKQSEWVDGPSFTTHKATNYEDRLGNYTASGAPYYEEGPSTWTGDIFRPEAGATNRYAVRNAFASHPDNVHFIDVTAEGGLVFNDDISLGEVNVTETLSGHVYGIGVVLNPANGEMLGVLPQNFTTNLAWDINTGTITFPSTVSLQGYGACPVLFGLGARVSATNETYFMTELYQDLVLTLNSGTPAAAHAAPYMQAANMSSGRVWAPSAVGAKTTSSSALNAVKYTDLITGSRQVPVLDMEAVPVNTRPTDNRQTAPVKTVKEQQTGYKLWAK